MLNYLGLELELQSHFAIEQKCYKSGFLGLGGGGSAPSAPAAPPPPPTAAQATSIADNVRDGQANPDGQTYASTLLTGSASVPQNQVKKSALLGGN